MYCAETHERRKQPMTSKKPKHPFIPQGDDSHIQSLLEQRHTIAGELRESASRGQAETALTEISSAEEATQLALLKALARQPDVDAADVLLAINEVTPNKAVRKESRRALIQLAGNKIYPSWTPQPEKPTILPTTNAPRFWKGQVTLMREQGEIELILCWEQGFEYGEARMLSFLLDYWQDGVKDFTIETGTKRHIESHLNEQATHFTVSTGEKLKLADATLAEGRRLLLDALSVNKWRGTTPHKDYRHYLPTVQQLILNAPQLDEDRGRTFIDPGLEPDEIAAHFIGGWSLGDFGLCYDLLTHDSPIREGLARDEWVERRRAWADEAQPAHFEPRVTREREHNQSALWLPGSFLSDRSTSRREVETCWSLELSETPLSGTLPEMPLGTAVLKETGRHWFWTSYTIVQEEGEWRIQRVTDDGANAQGLPLADVQQRLQEHAGAIQDILKNQTPTGPDAPRYYEEIIWRTTKALYYLDALLVKNPLDFELYADAVGRATSIGMNERAFIYLERWAEHFPHHASYASILQQLGAVAAVLAQQYDEIEMQERAERFYDLSETTLQKALQVGNQTLTRILLAEVKASQNAYEEAQSLLQEALASDPTREEEAQIENDLASMALERDLYDEALRHFLRVAEISPNFQHIWFSIGHAYRLLKNTIEAEVYYKRAIEEEPQNIAAYSELGALYLSKNETNKAYKVVEQGTLLHPQSAHLRGLLAGIILDQGDLRRARAVLEEAERINPDAEIVQAVRQSLDSIKR